MGATEATSALIEATEEMKKMKTELSEVTSALKQASDDMNKMMILVCTLKLMTKWLLVQNKKLKTDVTELTGRVHALEAQYDDRCEDDEL